ncbi:helix-turn-helix transcriptional regulator [Niabella beijingensis]|uniref:helix-turn-helix transcriptional regulator n=1 Tax=Niabella beijingensis TaxID=2872700 RepID=UPI001CBCD509|nr:helix-turn-helix domain-containing protein [Niabella beijingensis]MBZ4190446.1 helix-turn-helix domain-containing protein [Niabella beijingensis]
MKSLRTQLHLTQREMADLIGVSYSVIALYEKGRRNLPTKASIKLAQLQLSLQQQPLTKKRTEDIIFNQQQSKLLKLEKVLNSHARKAAAKEINTSFILGKMEDRYKRLIEKLAFIHRLMEDTSPTSKEMSLLQNMELTVMEGLDNCSYAKQRITKYKLEVLKGRKQAALQTMENIQQTIAVVKSS